MGLTAVLINFASRYPFCSVSLNLFVCIVRWFEDTFFKSPSKIDCLKILGFLSTNSVFAKLPWASAVCRGLGSGRQKFKTRVLSLRTTALLKQYCGSIPSTEVEFLCVPCEVSTTVIPSLRMGKLSREG